MALVPAGLASNRLRNYCIFGAVQSFDPCFRYGNQCSSDSSVDDGWFICEYHSSVHFKIEKMVLPIPDADNNIYYRTVGRSLVGDKEMGNARVLIPSHKNYETVLNVEGLPLAERLIIYIIYGDKTNQDNICKILQYNENYREQTYKIVEEVYSKTMTILNMTDPTVFCSRVAYDNRLYSNADENENDIGDQNFIKLPNFIKNLIEKAVAPEIIKIDTETLCIRNCPTCKIDSTGLVADVTLYNPVKPKHRVNVNENILRVENVLKFQGNANALQRSLARYDNYSIDVPLILGKQTLYTNKEKPFRKFYNSNTFSTDRIPSTSINTDAEMPAAPVNRPATAPVVT
ncbi:vp39 [Cryptophlebia peltastica nucleopolyhedrovirus]|uniref:Vp39 n=1 Tax=Cryptophlebia peltastica nucleopolyhedrovirus TaxID=2304025 RepID=A0A346RNT7_9ABAC|nr:vp39 [Cryptophlebia peltastica nucleopolyhedrovirus]AXS67734.1 vp39 [Cryptophlebia peltastica nucleopolyhedrovirus]